MYDDQDDISILKLEIDDFLKDKVSDREQQLRSATIDSLVSRELKEEQALTGYDKLRKKVNDLALSVGVASGVSGLVGYLHDESVAEYAVKGGLVAVTSAAIMYGIGKTIMHFYPSQRNKSDKEKRIKKVREYDEVLNTRKNFHTASLGHKAAIIGIFSGAIALVGGVLVAAPYAALAAWYGIGAGTGLAAASSEVAVKTGTEFYSRKQKLEQYDLERARLVGAELFKK